MALCQPASSEMWPSLWYSLIFVTPMLVGASSGDERGNNWFVANYAKFFRFL
jgi:hypothetical protein